MPSMVEVDGRPASPGLALGPLVILDEPPSARRKVGPPDDERRALAAAIAAAIADLAGLIDSVDAEGGAMLAFQMAMAEDDELSAPAYAAIASGSPADEGWRAALDRQIADYATAGDDYFRARTADLEDLRDRVLDHLTGVATKVAPPGSVLAGRDLSPTRFLETDWSAGGGIVLTAGSTASHVAILARARGVPMVVGLGDVGLNGHARAAVDGSSGRIVLSPDAAAQARFALMQERRRSEQARLGEIAARPACTRDGVPVAVLVNVAGVGDVEGLDVTRCDGIGLMRTEFLFRDGDAPPDEDAQYAVYRRLIDWAAGRPVTIRTLDAGGDKPVAGITVDDETNTFLGVRGIRLSFAREAVFRTQLRALARAAVHGPLKVMWPMVTAPDELTRAAALFDEELAALKRAGFAAARPALGMMVEVPAPAIAPDLFSAAEFFSIGSNDLIQYVAAAARDNDAVAPLGEAVVPVIMRLIAGLTDFAHRTGIEVSICGDLGGDTTHLPALIGAGLRSVSVAPAALGRVKAAIAEIDCGERDGQS